MYVLMCAAFPGAQSGLGVAAPRPSPAGARSVLRARAALGATFPGAHESRTADPWPEF